MNNQPPLMTPKSSGFGSASGSLGGTLMLVLTIVLGVGALTFAILSLHYYDTAATATKTLNAQVAAGEKTAAANQQKTDVKANVIADETPFRSFKAPDAYGSFLINFPKNWSSWVDEEQSGTQVTLILNPDFVTVTNDTSGLAAVRITLQEETSTEFLNNYTSLLAEGKMQQSNTTISGQPGFVFTGTFPNERTVREIVVPVRDKVLVFDNENAQYANEFDEVLSQAKVNP